MEIREIIIESLTNYIGKKEIKGNQGFSDKEFERKIKAVGWNIGEAWCAYFGELVWKESYQKYNATYGQILDRLFSASAVKTFKNFRSNREFSVNLNPAIGSIAVWQTYRNSKPHWSGHLGIVTKIEGQYIYTCDGNTNASGGREGIEVAVMKRKKEFGIKEKGLVLLGFIHPVR